MRRRRGHLGVVPGLLLLLLLLTVTAAAGLALAQEPDKPLDAGEAPAAAPGKKKAAAPAKAPAPPAGAAAEAPELALSASVASVDKLAAFATEAGLGELPFLSTGFIEQQIPFIGAGGLAGDRPLGVVFYAGPGVDLERATTFVLPVMPGKAQLRDFRDAGAKPLEGREDVVELEQMAYRRSEGLFVFGQVSAAVAAVPEDALASAYAGDDDLLARVDLDVAAIKRAMPEAYERQLAEIEAGAEIDRAAARLGADLVMRPLRRVTRAGLSLGRAEGGGLRVGLAAEPFALPDRPAGRLERPGFPAGTLLRADLRFPPARVLGPVADALAALVDQDKELAAQPAAHRRQMRQVVTDAAKLLLEAEAGSLGVQVEEDGTPVLYWVTRQAADAPDLATRMKAVAGSAQALAAMTGEDAAICSLETYPLDGEAAAQRLVVLDEDGTPGLYVDGVQRGATFLLTLAPADGKFLGRLLSLKPEGETASLLGGWLDLSALAAAGLLPPAEEAGLGETAMKELTAALQGHRLSWNVSPEGPAVRLDVDIPKELVRTLAEVSGLTQ